MLSHFSRVVKLTMAPAAHAVQPGNAVIMRSQRVLVSAALHTPAAHFSSQDGGDQRSGLPEFLRRKNSTPYSGGNTSERSNNQGGRTWRGGDGGSGNKDGGHGNNDGGYRRFDRRSSEDSTRPRRYEIDRSNSGASGASGSNYSNRFDRASNNGFNSRNSASANGGVQSRFRNAFVQRSEEEMKPMQADIVKDSADKNPEERVPLSKFTLSTPLKRGLENMGITELYPVQAACFEPMMKGKHVLVRSRTGTGKTLGFCLPMLERFSKEWNAREPKVLILAPTRELAHQTHKVIIELKVPVRVSCFYGGASYSTQFYAIKNGIDVLVGTVGRIGDLIEKGALDLGKVKAVVLDEADTMLDMGFKNDVESILKEIPGTPEVHLFSATVPTWVGQISRSFQVGERVTIDLVGRATSQTASGIEHYFTICDRFKDMPDYIMQAIEELAAEGKTLIFTRTKLEADVLASKIDGSHALHSDVPQSTRQRIFDNFKKGTIKVLVATSVAGNFSCSSFSRL
jgi:hypothetical protein